jgi:hypothetical protein
MVIKKIVSSSAKPDKTRHLVASRPGENRRKSAYHGDNAIIVMWGVVSHATPLSAASPSKQVLQQHMSSTVSVGEVF